jgi:hypothetical protein
MASLGIKLENLGVRYIFAVFLCLMNPAVSRAETPASSRSYTKWMSGSGVWTDLARWSDGLPNSYQRVEVHGNGTVMIPKGTYLLANLQVGINYRDHARVEVDGGEVILLQDSLHVGELTGGEGEFILKDGVFHNSMDTYIGGANGVPGRSTRASFIVQGGSYLGRTLILGSGWGAESYAAIEESHASAIHILQYVYVQANAGSDGTPGTTTLSFTLDEHGVTPITIQSVHDGLRIMHDATSRCRLQILLSSIPPREDVTLVSSHVPIKGTFDDLPEGSEIKADYERKSYRWQLTYRGGASGCDLVLKNKSDYAADAPVTHTRPLPDIPRPLWADHPMYPPFAPGNSEPAFPGAEGFGAFTPGGRGGQTIEVTNLEDAGPGSLRAAVNTPGPRIIAFKVGGAIALKSPLVITHPFVTFDAQNAPAPGILLRNHGIEVQTHDVVLRHFRVRVGDGDVNLNDPKAREAYYSGAGEYALCFIEGSKNCIADHLSLSWSTTKILTVNKLCDLVTVQWCILSEALNFADHGLGVIVGQGRQTWHHNLIAHNQSRNPRFASLVNADFRNNVIYDWGDTAGCGEFDRVNYVGNYLKPGPSTRKQQRLFHDGVDVVMPKSLFLADNILEGNRRVNEDNWQGVGYDRESIAAPGPFVAPAVTTEPAQVAYDRVLKEAGATLPLRDAVDARVVQETRAGTGRVIKWVKDAGGWPDFPSSTDSAKKAP